MPQSSLWGESAHFCRIPKEFCNILCFFFRHILKLYITMRRKSLLEIQRKIFSESQFWFNSVYFYMTSYQEPMRFPGKASCICLECFSLENADPVSENGSQYLLWNRNKSTSKPKQKAVRIENFTEFSAEVKIFVRSLRIYFSLLQLKGVNSKNPFTC